MEPLEPLYAASGLVEYPLPDRLRELHGDGFGFDREEILYSNFVSSLDGVVALGDGISAGSVISGKDPADRFLMALLRACADAVLVGAGTVRATPGHRWTPDHLVPELADEWAELRRRLGRAPQPRLAVLTASGALDLAHPGILAGATIVTGKVGAARLADRLPQGCDVIVASEVAEGLAALRERGHRAILTEGGPTVMGRLFQAGLLDETFLTLAPVLAGRSPQEHRPGFVDGVELLPEHAARWTLLSVHRHGGNLFLRHRR